jgi:hypothetical protein
MQGENGHRKKMTPTEALVRARNAKVNGTHPKIPGALTQVFGIQRRLYETMHDEKVTPSALAQLARAWCECEERKRILRMKPKPRDVDVSGARAIAKSRAVLAMPEEPPLPNPKSTPAQDCCQTPQPEEPRVGD